MFVDYLDRLGNLRALLSPKGAGEAALRRPLCDAVPALRRLLIEEGPDADTLYGRSALPPRQEERLLDFMLALYGETPGPLIPRRPGADPRRHSIAVKRDLLDRLVLLGARRGRGGDYLSGQSRRRASNLALRARLLMATRHGDKKDRPRIAVIEHILLRSRGTEEAGPRPVEPLAITAMVRAGERLLSHGGWRSDVVRMLRAETPAHLDLHVRFLDRPEWRALRRLRRLWREALRDGSDEAIDLVSRELVAMLERHAEEDRGG